MTLKLIQVYVTDKNGKPVTNLDKSEFRVFDNGQLQTITEFERHMSPAPSPGITEPPIKEAVVSTEITAPRLGRKFFVFIDLDSNDLEGIAKSRAAALHFLDTQTLPSDEIGVFSSSFMRGIVLHTYLTTDHVKVREAIQRIREVPGRKSGGTGDASTPTIVVSGQDSGIVIRSSVSSGGGPSTDRMIALAKALRYIPGYKNILYFSQGGSINDRAYRDRLDEMSREFAASNAPFYAVNTETPDPFSPGGTKGGDLLAFVAERSGGRAYKDIGAVAHFADIARDIQDLTRNYYVLGYPVRESWDGKYHKIKVEMRSGDYRVQAQPGYFNPKPFREYSDLEKDLHLFDLAMSEKTEPAKPMIFAMRALHFANKNGAQVLMLSKIPPEVIEKFTNRKIELVSLIFDEQDNPVDRKQTKPDLAKYRSMDVFYSSEALLKPGAYRCRFIIRDLDTGEAALAFALATVPVKAGSGLSLFSPMLLIAGSNFAYWDMGTKKNTAPWMDLYSYDHSLYSPVMEIPKGTSRIFAVVPFRTFKSDQPDIAYTAHLIDSISGGTIPLTSSVLNRTRLRDVAVQFLEFPMNDVPPGKYVLYLHAEDAASGAISYTQTSVVIR
ncbi:MAG: VWA domain-containing protein [Candidatus Aminicenantes bacterium]|nr:VWA domain-containing protein [Candidatus Aminicenantes bacterium]